MTGEPIYVVHREQFGSSPWVVLECHPDRLAAKVLATCHDETIAHGIVGALTDSNGRAAFTAARIDAESPF